VADVTDLDSHRAGEDMRLLRERGADTLDHPGGTLLAHLVRTGERLKRSGAAPVLVTAGRWHAAYGTDGFATALFDLDERALVAREIGEEAEAIVYRYGSCDRRFVYPQIGGQEPVQFRDRFTGTLSTVNDPALRLFAELTVANEVDVLAHSESFRQTLGPAIAERFLTWSRLLSPAACADLQAVLADTGG
jgi:hypothetical protein